jgi:hypothetical protein
MYTVALIQNQSEMSHYGYGDARPLLKEFGYHFVLYTAQNIDDLAEELRRAKFDAIIFATNALNDKTIRENVMSDDFMKSFDVFIKNRKGCLILHQIRMSEENILPEFLPKPLSDIQLIRRDKKENESDGNFYLTSIVPHHVCFCYPHTLKIEEVKDQSLSFRSLRGLYWHYFGNVRGEDWDILLYDVGPSGLERPLIVTSKESEHFRIVLCSLPLDWQKQKRLLQNILTYVVEGKHYTAILKDSQKTNIGFEYFIDCLKSQKYPFSIYNIDQNLDDFERNIRTDIHGIIIFDPFVNVEKRDKRIASLITDHINKGKVKLIGITHENELTSFFIAGREKFALRLLHDLELKIQNELEKGYIDGSFLSTIESLQTLNEISSYTKSKYDAQVFRKVLEKSDTHDRDGSYDRAATATCGLLWLRSTYVSPTDESTQRSLQWIRANLDYLEDRDKVFAYHTVVDCGVATNDERASLKNLLIAQQSKLEHLSEIDLVVYLGAAIKINATDITASIVKQLMEIQQEGCFVDLATTATAVTTLLDASKLLRMKDSATYASMKGDLERLIFKSILYIQNARDDLSNRIMYPWDNKASTSLKCIQAWLKFEALIDLPVHELIDALKSYSITERMMSATKTSLRILDDLKKKIDDLRSENETLSQEKSKLSAESKKHGRISKQNKYLGFAFLSTLYVLLSIVVASLYLGLNTSINDILSFAFIKGWPFHVAFLTLIVAVFGVIYYKSIWDILNTLWKQIPKGGFKK